MHSYLRSYRNGCCHCDIYIYMCVIGDLRHLVSRARERYRLLKFSAMANTTAKFKASFPFFIQFDFLNVCVRVCPLTRTERPASI